LDDCLQILIDTNRLPEAAFFARTYLPSQVSNIVKLWKESLSKTNPKAADALADPTDYENLFPGFKETLKTEQYLKATTKSQPAKNYPNVKVIVSCFH
jgi:coatomer subunit beta'